jgi:hypothetical protein
LVVKYVQCDAVFKITANVSQLGDVADFQHQTFTNIDKFLMQQLSFQKMPKPAISPSTYVKAVNLSLKTNSLN